MADVKEDYATLNIYQKLARITGEVGKIDKTGQSSGYGDKYSFIEYAAVAGRLRELFAKYGVVVVPRMQQAHKQQRAEIVSKNGTKGSSVLIDFTFNVVNADKPEDKFTVTWTGEAADYGDKATNKAATAALKYYLMRQFNISEKGEDPDADTHHIDDTKPSVPRKQQASETQRVKITDLAQKAGYDEEWIADVQDKVKLSDDAAKVIKQLEAKTAETPKEALSAKTLGQIKKTATEAGASAEWLAGVIASTVTEDEGIGVLDELADKMQQEPQERVWK